MAKNWKMNEAVRAIQSGNKEDIADIGKRFPLFANLAAQVNEAGAALIDCVPEYCTARKIESVLKGDIKESEETEDDIENEDEAPKAEKKAAKKADKKPAKKVEADDEDEDEDDLSSKSAKELYDMCKKAGLKVKPKQDKSVYIDALNAANEDEDEEDGWEEEEEAPKKPAKKADKKPAKKAEEEDDDDWEV